MSTTPGPALVIGAGICGLATAAVLARHFPSVILIDRDTLPDGDTSRRGTSQAHHVHGLLALGAQRLEELFPGLREELRTDGAPVFDHGGAARTRVWAGTIPQATAGVEVQTVHRDHLEAAVRRRVAALPQVTIQDGTLVEGLVLDRTGSRVTQVKTSVDGEVKVLPEGPEEVSLVVEASGRFSALPKWLEAVGYPSPAETSVDADLAYTSRMFEAPEQPVHGLQQINQAPGNPRGAYAADIGQGRWLITLFGAAGDHPPADSDGFNAFADSLNNADLTDLLEVSTPLGGSHSFKATRNQLRAYAELSRVPDRLIALGDSQAAYNPVFGQGMTVAAMQAAALDQALSRHTGEDLTGLSRKVQRKAAGIARIPWLMATFEDKMWEHHNAGTTPPLHVRASAWYKQRLLHQAVHSTDPALFLAFLHVYHMNKTPLAMAAPRILVKALLRGRNPKHPPAPHSASPNGSQTHKS